MNYWGIFFSFGLPGIMIITLAVLSVREALRKKRAKAAHEKTEEH